MSLTVSSSGGSFTEVEAGSHLARCVRLIDLGTQEGEYQGKKTTKKQILIYWELPHELIDEGEHAGKPRTMSKFYTASTDEKANLRKDLQAWRGRAFTEEEIKGFNVLSILGVPCMLSVVHNDKGKAVISSVGQVPKGMTCPPQILPSIAFDLDLWMSGDHDQNQVYGELTDGVKGLIGKSLEVRGKGGVPGQEEVEPNEIPF